MACQIRIAFASILAWARSFRSRIRQTQPIMRFKLLCGGRQGRSLWGCLTVTATRSMTPRTGPTRFSSIHIIYGEIGPALTSINGTY